MQMSALNDFISSSASGVFQLFGWWTGRPFSRGEQLQRIFRPARLVGRAAHRDDILAALEQLLEHGLAEGLLAMNDDTHRLLSLPGPAAAQCAAQAGVRFIVECYSAAAFFTGGSVAPEALIAATSSAE